MEDVQFTGYIRDSILYLKYGDYQGILHIKGDENFFNCNLHNIIDHLNTYKVFSTDNNISFNCVIPYGFQIKTFCINLSNKKTETLIKII